MGAGEKVERIRDDVDRVTPATDANADIHEPYVPADVQMTELTWSAVAVGAILGIIFGASSLYLVLKVGMTVSASIPVAVLSITLFRGLSHVFGFRRATILENNIVQTTGSAGESIAFGVGVTIPALMLLGFDMEVTRVMTVGVLGGLLGILMMIPLRRAFIVKQHKELPYPEGTACADVLIVGEEGGSSAKTVFAGFGIAFVYNLLMKKLRLWHGDVNQPLYTAEGEGLRGGVLGAEITPELLGVGYIIGPRIASITFAGGVLAYLVLVPAIVLFGSQLTEPVFPARSEVVNGVDRGLIGNMSPSNIRDHYILYIGAGAVAAGGIISMFQALPLIIGSMAAGLRDLRGSRGERTASARTARTERDMPMSVVLFGSLALVLALAAFPNLGLGFDLHGLVGAAMIVIFGFLFVTVSSRLTGLIGSSSNPISGMTVATLLLTCLVFLLMGRTDKPATLTALTVAAVVCIAASNGGTTAQDLKTGHLVGATPKNQQWAIIIGALTSALFMGVTLLLLNEAGTVYTTRDEYLPNYVVPPETLEELTQMERPGGEYAAQDDQLYHVLNIGEGEIEGVPQGKYLVDDGGQIRYLIDPAINGRVRGRNAQGNEARVRDDGSEVSNSFDAPKTRLMALIIDGILNQKLPWGLVLIGVLIAITLELAKVPSLPFAVGVYLPIQVSAPIFVGGMMRLAVDKYRARRGSASAEAEFSPGVLLCSGYIAGGAIAGVLVAFMEFLPPGWNQALTLQEYLPETWQTSQLPAVVMFSLLILFLALVGSEKLLRTNKIQGVERSKRP
ncbi:MAG: oligopeptide transporter, OPT family [Pirellulales bacterium]